MNKTLENFLERIYGSGQEHDSGNYKHEDRMLNITPDTGNFLSILVQATHARNVLEIGTSNGYSTLWLADAVSRNKGKVRTVEVSKQKHRLAVENFRESQLESYIEPVLKDARSFIKELDDSSVDLLFLDAERTQYDQYWEDLDRVLRRKGLMVVDNAIAPKPEELILLRKLIEGSKRYNWQIIDIGKGELLALKLS